MTPEENKLFILRFVEETINRKDLDAINELVAENFVEHVPFPGQGPGREGLMPVGNRLVVQTVKVGLDWLAMSASARKTASGGTVTHESHLEQPFSLRRRDWKRRNPWRGGLLSATGFGR